MFIITDEVKDSRGGDIPRKRAGFCYIRIKKGEGQVKYVTFSTMMYTETGERLEMTTHHVPFRQMID